MTKPDLFRVVALEFLPMFVDVVNGHTLGWIRSSIARRMVDRGTSCRSLYAFDSSRIVTVLSLLHFALTIFIPAAT